MKQEIERLGYRPPAPYQLDLEVFSMADLRRRGKEQVRVTHRYEFHTLVCVTQGTCTQMVDFKSVSCAPGSLLVLRAGQAHNYGREQDWDGWNLLFRPEFLELALDLERLPAHMVLSRQALGKVTGLFQQLDEDTRIDAPQEKVHALLRHQLHALLTRLGIVQGGRPAQEAQASSTSQRFQRFRELVDQRFVEWHQVADYASELCYTERTLARAVTAAAGTTAKAFIAARINLEAKRLLVHTDLPVVSIAGKLGFDEPTNFSKFFKRETGCTPAEFRRRQRE